MTFRDNELYREISDLFLDGSSNLRIEILEERSVFKTCYRCNHIIGTFNIPIRYYRVIIKNGSIERSYLFDPKCFKDVIESNKKRKVFFYTYR